MKILIVSAFMLIASFKGTAQPLIYLVQSQSLPEYKTAIAAIKSELSSSYNITETTIERSNAKAVSNTIKQAKPSLIISIGTKSTKLLQTHIKRTPILFSMVYRPDRTDLVKSLKFPGTNSTGVALDIPLDLQFSTLRKIFPYMRRIGTLYTPYLDQELIDQATMIAKKYQFTLTSQDVYSQDQIQQKLELLFRNQIQLLWSTADQKIYSKTSLQYILLSLNRFKVPFMGLSQSYLKLGAYVSLDPDPNHIGKKTALMAHRMIQNRQNPMITPVEFPDEVNYSVNEKVLNQFGFSMQSNVLKNAELIYK